MTEELVEMEQDLRTLPGRPSEAERETPKDHRPVVDAATREGDVVRFDLETVDGEASVTLPWPEYDDDSEPLARVLAAADLDLSEFSKIVGRRIPVFRTSDGLVVDVPPEGTVQRVGWYLTRQYLRFNLCEFNPEKGTYENTTWVGHAILLVGGLLGIVAVAPLVEPFITNSAVALILGTVIGYFLLQGLFILPPTLRKV